MEKKQIKIELAPEEHKSFKMACLEAGQTMTQALKELINYYIKNPMQNANK